MVIVDTGFWVALYSVRDRHHAAALKAGDLHVREGFITTGPVIAETCHLLLSHAGTGAMLSFVEALAESDTEIDDIDTDRIARAAQSMRKYRDLPMDFADASLLMLAERLGHGRILTTDQRDFGAYRWKSQYPFENLLEPM